MICSIKQKNTVSQKFACLVAAILIVGMLVFAGCTNSQSQGSNNTAAQDSTSQVTENQNSALPNVVVLTTGGTIAGSGEEGKSTGYKSGAISGNSLVESVPQIAKYANITTEEICNVNSDDITGEIWIKLAKRINEITADPSISGVVVTHGTDTMEETAYFLNLTVKTDKPVVITGSMRPSTAVSADGPLNLLDAVRIAACKDAKNKGVMCAFSDLIYPARTFSKTSTYSVNAMSSGETGAMGIVRDDGIFFFHTMTCRQTKDSEFDVSNSTKLPTVDTVFFDVDADAGLLQTTLAHAEGIVVSGAGAGEYSEKFKSVLEKTTKPVLLTSHTGAGPITQSSTILPDKVVACNYLSPQKAKVLLRVVLNNYPNVTFDELKRITLEY